MREYRFQATDETLEALRRLRAPWIRFAASEFALTVQLQGGDSVRIAVDTVDVEGVFDAYRLNASTRTSEASRHYFPESLSSNSPGNERLLDVADSGATAVVRPAESAESFANSGNDVVLFSGASWSEPAGFNVDTPFGEQAVMTFSGHAGQISETAEIVCVTTDAVVVASTTGEGMLIRTGLKPESIEVVRDALKVRAFLVERGYENEQ